MRSKGENNSKYFSNLGVMAQSEVMANIAKDELRDKLDAENITLIVNEVKMTIDRSTGLKPTSAEVKKTLAKDNLGNTLIRLASFENFKRNYVNGIVSRIPGFVRVKIESTPLFVNGKPTATTAVVGTLTNISRYRQQLETETNPVKYNQIQVNIDSEIASLDEDVRDLAKSQVLFDAPVPISQFGKLAVIPVTSNTFVKQTKTLAINKDTGAIGTYDFNATSSGKTASKMLENIPNQSSKKFQQLLKH